MPVYASGPQAHLLTVVNESSYIYQVMAYALGIDGAKTKQPALHAALFISCLPKS